MGEDELNGERRPDSEENSGVGDAICGYGGGAEAPDRWICRGRNLMWIRQHRTPRSSLFLPSGAERGPSKMSELWSVRKTEGQMKDGRRFTITDDWAEAEKSETNDIRQMWTGVTTFIIKTPENKLKRMQMKQDYDIVHDSQS